MRADNSTVRSRNSRHLRLDGRIQLLQLFAVSLLSLRDLRTFARRDHAQRCGNVPHVDDDVTNVQPGMRIDKIPIAVFVVVAVHVRFTKRLREWLHPLGRHDCSRLCAARLNQSLEPWFVTETVDENELSARKCA